MGKEGRRHERVGEVSKLPPLPRDLENRLEKAIDVLRSHPVRLAYLFGSMTKTKENQDIDIAVFPDRGFSYRGLYADLSLALNTDRLDLVDMRFAPSYLLDEIFRGRLLHSVSEEETARFEGGQRSRWREELLLWRKKLEGESSMSLRVEFLVQALNELERVARELEKYREVTAEMLEEDLSLRWTVERGLLAGLTLIFQISDHLARAFRKSVDTYEGLLLELKSVGVISNSLYQKLKGSGGFRNVLVHEYVRIDPREVVSVLRDAPDVFMSFKREIIKWLEVEKEKNEK